MFNYSQKILDHFYNPRNVATLSYEDPEVGTGVVGSEQEARMIRLQIECNGEEIIPAVFKAHGGVSCIALCSWLTLKLPGLSLVEAQRISSIEIAYSLQLPQQEAYYALMADDAIKKAILYYTTKQKMQMSL